MKKNIFLLMTFTALFITSCSKSDDSFVDERKDELFEVTLKATGFEQTLVPMTLKTSAAKNIKSNMMPPASGPFVVDFLIYDQNGFFGRYHSTLSDEKGTAIAGGEKVTMELPKGRYRVYALAYHAWDGDFYWEESLFGDYYFSFSSTQVGRNTVRRFSPLYVCKFFSFDVEGSTITENIELIRFNAQIEIDILDEIPEHVSYILFGGHLSSDILLGNNQKVNTGDPQYQTGYIKLDVASLRNANEKVLSSVFYPSSYSTASTSKPDSYDILFFDNDNNLLGTKKIDDVIFKENHITRLSGKLFDSIDDPTKSGLFSISINEDYSPEIIEQNF